MSLFGTLLFQLSIFFVFCIVSYLAFVLFGSSILLSSLFFVPLLIFVVLPVMLVLTVFYTYLANNLHRESKPQRNNNWLLTKNKALCYLVICYLCLVSSQWVLLHHNLYYYLIYFFVIFFYFKTLSITEQNQQIHSDKSFVKIFDVPVASLTQDSVVNKIENHISKTELKGFYHIVTADSLALLRAQKEPDFKATLLNAELIIPDGAGIVWAADFFNTPLLARVPGVALASEICKQAAINNWSLFIIGGKPDVIAKASQNLLSLYPNLVFKGVEHGYFKPDSNEENELLNKVVTSSPDIILVGMGVPRQEYLINKIRSKNLVSVAIGVGGSFDVISETLPRAPLWMQKFALEWLFRLWLEPFRLKRVLDIPVFVFQVFRRKIRVSTTNT